MRWRNIKLIFHREVSDQLRDRRTLFMVAVLPLLLYPALGIGMLNMTLLFSEQPRTVVILGNDDLPPPALLSPDGERFDTRWFDVPTDTEKLIVVTDAHSKMDDNKEDKEITGETKTPSSSSKNSIDKEELLSDAQAISKLAEAYYQTQQEIHAANQPTEESQTRLDDLQRQMGEAFRTSQADVIIIFPPGFSEQLRQENQELVDRRTDWASSPLKRRPMILHNNADERSDIAYRRVSGAFEEWEREVLKSRLEQASLPQDLSNPIDVQRIDVAQEDQISANVWSKLFPALLVIMSVTGAFYPAIDLGAGEKERGTMETLLICPATRAEIVIGKFLTVMVFSICTAILNLVSMGMTGSHMLSMAGGQQSLSRLGSVAFPGFIPLMWVLLLAIPIAALFSALSLAFAIFARSSKEGQYYLTPLLLVSMGITVFCLSPANELTPFYSVLPIMGPFLLLKGLLLNSAGGPSLLPYAVPVLVSSSIYSLLALSWAIEQFRREDVLFRESERFEIKLWLRHLLRDKEEFPGFSEGLFCFVLVMLLQFALMNVFGQAFLTAAPGQQGLRMMQLLIVQQLVVIAFPALVMAIMLTTNPLKTLRLTTPRIAPLILAMILPLTLHPLALELQKQLVWFFPPLPEHAMAAMQTMADPTISYWFVLLTFALAPGICEELCFRGFILRGLQHSRKLWLPIFLSAFCFGIMHMIPQQVFNASLLGIVLGMLAVAGRSIYPAMVFHFLNNALATLHEKKFFIASTDGTLATFVKVDESGLQYQWPTLFLCIVVSVVLVSVLVRLSIAAHSQEYQGRARVQ